MPLSLRHWYCHRRLEPRRGTLPDALGRLATAHALFELADPLLVGANPLILGTGASFLFPGEILEPLENIAAARRLRFLPLAGNFRGLRRGRAFFLQLFLSRPGRPSRAHRLERISPHRKGPRPFFLFLSFRLPGPAVLALLFALPLALASLEQRRDDAEEHEQQE